MLFLNRILELLTQQVLKTTDRRVSSELSKRIPVGTLDKKKTPQKRSKGNRKWFIGALTVYKTQLRCVNQWTKGKEKSHSRQNGAFFFGPSVVVCVGKSR